MAVYELVVRCTNLLQWKLAFTFSLRHCNNIILHIFVMFLFCYPSRMSEQGTSIVKRKQYPCSVCDKRLSSAYRVKEHIKHIHGGDDSERFACHCL